MLAITLFLCFVAPLIVLAQNSCTKVTVQTCSTQMASVPFWWYIPTVTRTKTMPTTTLTGSTTVYTTKTVPGLPITVSSTTTTTSTVTTTALAGTDTLSLTATITTTVAATTTTVSTGTATSTVVSTSTLWNTSVMPAPSAFIPAYNSSGDVNYAGAKRAIGQRGDLKARTLQEKRSLATLLQQLQALKAAIRGNRGALAKKNRIDPLKFVNPVAVNCVASIAPTCRVGALITSTLTTTAAPSTTTSTISATAFATKIVVPGNVTTTITVATLTATFSTNILVTSTAMTTATSILTSILTSTSTSYAACATNNVLGPRIVDLGSGTVNALSHVYYYDSDATVVTTSQISAYDCCVACQKGDSCQFFQYTGSNSQCWVIGGNANWCPNNQQDYSYPAYYVYNDPSVVAEQLTVGNGGCGTVMDVGHE